MATYTPNYGLHQWVPEDNFQRTDFNEDLSKIDTALGGKTGIVTGTYTGNGSSQSITLGFRPKAVIVKDRDDYENTYHTNQITYTPCVAIDGAAGDSIIIQSDGFGVTSNKTVNTNTHAYVYIVFR
ncbi:hypothetical protein [Pseudoflavonifractor phocaeensis]|uniref:hypothetical protein n=1 Tax=Pseudoflavonifractor phocaeensis TaxID=1870988 RepID=UPI00195B46D0|nr:hypothetical protein [Pseudoflavonifractor phocaeensis]MBM6927425.1 hypothetical protein [Pseudoflavonifractor phocaeensis]